jgi:hypothetical protein
MDTTLAAPPLRERPPGTTFGAELSGPRVAGTA